MLDVRQLVRHHARHFLVGQRLQQAGGGGDRGVLRIAPGGEGVGLGVVHDEHPRHGQIRPPRQLPHHADELRRGRLIHLPRAVHAQDHLVRIPVAEQVHACRHDECDHHSAASAEGKAHGHEQGGHAGEQDRRLQVIHPSLPVPRTGRGPWTRGWEGMAPRSRAGMPQRQIGAVRPAVQMSRMRRSAATHFQRPICHWG